MLTGTAAGKSSTNDSEITQKYTRCLDRLNPQVCLPHGLACGDVQFETELNLAVRLILDREFPQPYFQPFKPE